MSDNVTLSASSVSLSYKKTITSLTSSVKAFSASSSNPYDSLIDSLDLSAKGEAKIKALAKDLENFQRDFAANQAKELARQSRVFQSLGYLGRKDLQNTTRQALALVYNILRNLGQNNSLIKTTQQSVTFKSMTTEINVQYSAASLSVNKQA